MMEAMSFGIPVIGTNVGGVSEIIEHETNGFLLSPTPSKEEVAAAIERFCSLTHDEVQTMRNNAYNTWDTKFNAQKNYKEFIRLIQSL
jgi:glycosyltransferase involved in cell wall biosynthesis